MTIEITGGDKRKEFEKNKKEEPGIRVICGPMFSGKTDTLIRDLNKFPHGGYRVKVFYPQVDNRGTQGTVNSYNGLEHKAVPIKNSKEILEFVDLDLDIVAIDEAQFFDMDLVEEVIKLAEQKKIVFVVGLDRDFKGEPFGPMAVIKQMAEKVTSLQAYCELCGKDASFTQRMIIERDEEDREIRRRPANYNDPLILVAGADDDRRTEAKENLVTEYYEARCREHHEVPDRPKKRWIFVAQEND